MGSLSIVPKAGAGFKIKTLSFPSLINARLRAGPLPPSFQCSRSLLHPLPHPTHLSTSWLTADICTYGMSCFYLCQKKKSSNDLQHRICLNVIYLHSHLEHPQGTQEAPSLVSALLQSPLTPLSWSQPGPCKSLL